MYNLSLKKLLDDFVTLHLTIYVVVHSGRPSGLSLVS